MRFNILWRAMFEVNTKRITASVFLIALGVALSPFYIPVGPIKLYPVQSAINVISGILLGPVWAVVQALFASTIRNLLGVGTIFAYPGSLIGSFLVGTIYWGLGPKLSTRQEWLAGFGEFIGTGLIGGTIAAYIIAPLFFPKQAAMLGALYFFIAFCANTVGFPIGNIILMRLKKMGITYKKFVKTAFTEV
ncbi:MAG: energy coupling factor transporter S component ThiW [Candidatus Methanomethylicaceae archaeon]